MWTRCCVATKRRCVRGSREAVEVVRAQQAAMERGAFDEAAIRANEVAGAPVKGTTTMVASIFDSRHGGKDWKMVQRPEQRKTQ